jgi:hypothetical protein
MGRGDRLVRWTTTASVVLLAAIAAIVSYRHMHTLVVRHGETPWTAAVLPLSVDGMIAASSMALLADSRHGQKSGILPWALLVAGSAASLAANIAVAEPTPVGRLIAAWPSFALIGSYELLMRQIRHSAHQTDDPQVSYEAHAITAPKTLPETISSDDAQTSGVMGAEPSDGAQLNPINGEPKSAEAQASSVLGRPIDREESVPPDVREADTRPRPRRQAVDLQRRAWEWALANRGPYGQLPAGRKIAEQFGRKERWGRLVKNAGLTGSIKPLAGPHEQNIAA